MEKLKCKVVILEVSDPQVSAKGQIYLATHDTNTKYPIRLLKDNPNSPTSYRKECKRQHLYFISNEEIEKDDCFIGLTPEFEQILVTPQNKKEYIGSGVFVVVKKVECSSDPSLGLPLIGQSFIEKYVEKQGKVDEVMLELVDNGCEEWVGDDHDGEPVWFEKIEIHTRKDNTVIIHPVKDSWTREEVMFLCESAFNHRIGALDHNTTIFNEWVKNNL